MTDMGSPRSLRGKAAIIGFGDSYTNKSDLKTPMRLFAEAIKAALEDANVNKDDIRGLICGRAPLSEMRPQWNNILAAYLKMTPTHSTEITIHGSGVMGMFKHAAMAVVFGFVDYVLCVAGDCGTLYYDLPYVAAALDSDDQFEWPYGPSVPALYAMGARRYMAETGATSEQMARFAVANQEWAVHHPWSMKGSKGPVTVEDVLNSRMIADPLHLWDCGMFGPLGMAGAFVVTTAERAKDHTNKPIYILGCGEASIGETLLDRLGLRSSGLPLEPLPGLTASASKVAALDAYDMAGFGPDGLDLVECWANFTFMGLQLLEDLGFCKKGEAGGFVEAGHIDVGGDLALNTHGGPLSFGQPGVSPDPIVECVRQLRGQALGKQVSGPKAGLVHGIGGMLSATAAVTILGLES